MTDQYNAGIVRVLQRVQDNIKQQIDEGEAGGFVDQRAIFNIGRLDAVIETLGGESSRERWR